MGTGSSAAKLSTVQGTTERESPLNQVYYMEQLVSHIQSVYCLIIFYTFYDMKNGDRSISGNFLSVRILLRYFLQQQVFHSWLTWQYERLGVLA